MKQKLQFEKVMSRDSSLVMTKVWQDYFANLAMQTRAPFPLPFYIYRDGITESWRPTEIFFGALPKIMEKKLKDGKNQTKILKFYKDYYKYSKDLKKRGHIPQTKKEISSAIERVIASSSKAGPGLIVGYWLSYWDEHFEKLHYPPGIVEEARKFRIHDALFDDTSEIIYQLIKNLAKRLYCPYPLLKTLTLAEIKKFIKNPESSKFQKLYQERKDGYMYYDSKVYKLSKLDLFLKRHHFALKKENAKVNVKKIWGQIAQTGRAKGTVRVIFNREQSSKFKNGDILVATMTTPWYLPLMKKAAAFVTDEGGMISHAAVIARELKKPCIVGTKIVTKVLKDGDMVEVDADKGIVRKL